MIAARTRASNTVLARSLPTRNASVGTPFIGEMVALVGEDELSGRLREAREDDPGRRARSRASTMIDSIVTIACASGVVGYIAP